LNLCVDLLEARRKCFDLLLLVRSEELVEHHLVPERQPVRGRHIARQIFIREAEYKKRVRIRYRRVIGGRQKEIVIVRHPQRVHPGVVSEPDEIFEIP